MERRGEMEAALTSVLKSDGGKKIINRSDWFEVRFTCSSATLQPRRHVQLHHLRWF